VRSIGGAKDVGRSSGRTDETYAYLPVDHRNEFYWVGGLGFELPGTWPGGLERRRKAFAPWFMLVTLIWRSTWLRIADNSNRRAPSPHVASLPGHWAFGNALHASGCTRGSYAVRSRVREIGIRMKLAPKQVK